MIEEKETIAISKFKATCLAVLKRVRKTGKPVVVTKFGQPVAEVVPPSPERIVNDWLGSMQGRGRVVGDIVAPVVEPEEWEILRD